MTRQTPRAVAILAYGMMTPATGGRDEQVSALLAGRPLFRRHPRWVGVDGMRQVMSYVAAIGDNGSFPDRLAHLLQRAYHDCRANQLERFGRIYHAPMILALPEILQTAGLYETFRAVAAGLDFDGVTQLHLVFGDDCGAMRGLAQAFQVIEGSPQPLVYLAAADSLVTPFMMDLRSTTGLARSSQHPWNPIPSEAAICTLLGSADNTPSAVLFPPSQTVESQNWRDPGRGLLGGGLRAAIEDQLSGHERPLHAFSDAHAERWRAEELGVIRSELTALLPDESGWHFISQAVGDLGAAGPLTAAIAAASLPGHSLILSSSRTGSRSAMLVNGNPLPTLDGQSPR
ncbi:hypothetical protein [Paracoccus xiamenensis]|uniref:hypothetical protein n=1 Tax=Paracoccus xiamenensis TaxID=2714901 RepID=UPI0014078C1E|nr:hypothetical protein [Paracoccus xiamenensis]NHF74544.1 hypothetical protein [Paracoccus xiamenensis]